MKAKAIFNWSGGKDSALALYKVLQDESFEVTSLITTISNPFNRISMHGVRRELLLAQAKSIGIPVQEILLPEMPSMSTYEDTMRSNLNEWKRKGISHSIFGDIFLEDLRKYREDKLNEVCIKVHFPLWKMNTTEVINEFIDLGFKTVVVCCKSDLLSSDFTGRIIDHDFLKDLPKNVDPCGENGEFHTFTFDGPIFKQAIPYQLGERIFKEYEAPKNEDDNCVSSESKKPSGFHYIDLIP